MGRSARREALLQATRDNGWETFEGVLEITWREKMSELVTFVIGIMCLIFSGVHLNDALDENKIRDWLWFIFLCFLGIINLLDLWVG